MLEKMGVTNNNPRKQFIKDFQEFIQTIKTNKDDYIMIGIDANETMTENNSDIRNLIQQCKLVDAYKHFHPDEEEFATHIWVKEDRFYILQ
jgi:hypothetical protein